MTNPIVSVRHVKDGDKQYDMHYYWCPGCDSLHGLAVRPGANRLGASWEFSGTLECPTYNPSVRSWYGEGSNRKDCHVFIREGMIEFLSDSTVHELRGKHPMVPLPDWVIQDEQDDTPD